MKPSQSVEFAVGGKLVSEWALDTVRIWSQALE